MSVCVCLCGVCLSLPPCLSLSVSVCACACACAHVCICTCAHVSMHVCMSGWVGVMCECNLWVCVGVCGGEFVCLLCDCVCTCVLVYVCVMYEIMYIIRPPCMQSKNYKPGYSISSSIFAPNF